MHHLIILDPHSVQNVIKIIYNTNTLCNYYFSQFVKHILDPQGFLGLEPVDFAKLLEILVSITKIFFKKQVLPSFC